MSGYIYKLFNNQSLTDAEKVEALRERLRSIIDAFSDDEGNIYNELYTSVLDEKDIANMSLDEIDAYIDDEIFSSDLMTCLLQFTNAAKTNWGASEASVAQAAGLVIVEVKFKDAEFKQHFYVEMSED